MENFYLILQVGNPLNMTYESRDEKEPPPAEGGTQRPHERGERRNYYDFKGKDIVLLFFFLNRGIIL